MIEKNNTSRNSTMIKILSVIAAMILWLYVMDEQNPSVSRIYNVRLSVANLPSDMVVLSDPTDVRVKLRGSRIVLSDVTSEEVEAFVNLQGVEKGSHSRTIEIKLPRDTQLVEVLPNKVVVDVDDLARRSVPIELEMTGEFPKDQVLDSAVLSPNHAIIYGPNSLLEKVDKVKAIFNVDENTKGEVKARVQLVAKDVNSNVVNKISLDPVSVFLTAIFKDKITTKTIPVKVFLQGKVAYGYKITSVKTVPEQIEITGFDKLVKDISEYSISNIDVSGLKDNFSKRVEIDLPDGVITSNKRINVLVSVEKQ